MVKQIKKRSTVTIPKRASHPAPAPERVPSLPLALGDEHNTGMRPASPIAQGEMLDFLGRVIDETTVVEKKKRKGQNVAKEKTYFGFYEPQTPDDRRMLRAAVERGYFVARGAKWRISEFGQQYYNVFRGQPYDTLLRCTSIEVYAANLFRVTADRLDDTVGAAYTMLDVTRIWAKLCSYEVFAALRGFGAELALEGEPEDVAAEVLRRLISNLHPTRLSGTRRDRFKAEFLS